MTNNYLEEFCASYNLRNLIRQPTCFKNPDNPTLFDHILTNHPKCFYSSSVYKTGLSDFNHFDNASFGADLRQELSLRNVMPGDFEKFNLNTFPRKSSKFMPL